MVFSGHNNKPEETPMLNWDHVFATRSSRMRASEIRELLKLLDKPDIISFAGGIPDRHCSRRRNSPRPMPISFQTGVPVQRFNIRCLKAICRCASG